MYTKLGIRKFINKIAYYSRIIFSLLWAFRGNRLVVSLVSQFNRWQPSGAIDQLVRSIVGGLASLGELYSQVLFGSFPPNSAHDPFFQISYYCLKSSRFTLAVSMRARYPVWDTHRMGTLFLVGHAKRSLLFFFILTYNCLKLRLQQ